MAIPHKFAMIAAALGLLAAIATTGAARADATRSILVTTYLRDGPSVQYRAVDEAQTGTRVSVRGCAHGWCNVVYGSVSGYVAQAMLTQATAPLPVPPTSAVCFTHREAGYHGGRDLRICPAGPATP